MSRLSIEIPDGLHRAIKSAASLEGMSLRDYVLQRLDSSAPSAQEQPSNTRFSESGLAGLWADRKDMTDPRAWVRARRQGRDFDQFVADAD